MTGSEPAQAASGNPRDAVVCVGLGRASATLHETQARLRAAVRPGGLLPLQDGHLREGVSIPLQELDSYREREETIAELCAHGDLVAGDWLAPKADACAHNARDLDGLKARAEALAARQPAPARRAPTLARRPGDAGAAPRGSAPAGGLGAAAKRAVRLA